MEDFTANPQVHRNSLMILNRLCVLTFLFFISFTSVRGQEKDPVPARIVSRFERAFEYFQQMELQQALELLDRILDKHPGHADSWALKGNCHLEMHQKKDAMEAFTRALTLEPEKFISLIPELTRLHFDFGHYQQAEEYLERFQYLDSLPDRSANPEFEVLIESVRFALEQIENQDMSIEVARVGGERQGVNRYFPSLTIDGSTLVYTAQSATGYSTDSPAQEDLFRADFDGYTLINNVPLSDQINTHMNEGTQTIRADGRMMFFTACHYADSKGGCDLYYAWKTRDGWSTPVNLGYPVNTRYWESTPCLSADSRTLYFASNRPGGFGGMDLWYSTYSKTTGWQEPVNMGRNINTERDEFAPFIHPDGLTLYFSSNGHVGMGNYDIYFSRMDTVGVWEHPVNLGYPINTFANEFGITVPGSGEYAVFSSERDSLMGRDLFRVNLPENMQPERIAFLRGRVLDSSNGQPLSATVEISEMNGSLLQTVDTDPLSGEFLIGLPTGREYAFVVRSKGYFYHVMAYSSGSSADLDRDSTLVLLDPLIYGSQMILKEVYFEFDSSRLSQHSYAEITQIKNLLQNHPNIIIEISGHTDAHGTAEYNQQLSLERAEAIKIALIEMGASQDRLVAKGYGEMQPVGDNNTEEGRALNRRTEIKIIR